MAIDNNDGSLTEQEISRVVAALQKLEPGYLPTPIFHQIVRLVVMSVVEVVPLRQIETGEVEVLLVKRPADDPHWSGMWHLPGVVVRPSDKQPDYAEAFKRIFQGELGLRVEPERHLVMSIFHHTKRGPESSRLYWAELETKPPVGTYFKSSDLPDNTIPFHREFIEAAVEDFRDTKTGIGLAGKLS